MDHHKFEDLISSYIENELSLKKRKKVEKYLINNPDAQEFVDHIKINIAQLKKIPKLKANKDFNKKLLNKIDRYDSNSIKKREGDLFFGFSVINASMITSLMVLLLFLVYEVVSPLNNSKIPLKGNFVDKEKTFPQVNNNKDKIIQPSQNFVDTNNDSINGSKKDYSNKIKFVND
ncbi:MAG: hypothetical protein CMG55_05250 [Candidatus Marinimicrobia bacterium]|nr:hypothetical protein [Candidatus Neomarinimicrobiota bacterium]|tara:strand:- start:2497 stop:3021 length:525 start_codon:yes stop_codon:yes gene_type:complete